MQNPLTLVIFGATGDLYQNKLSTALFDLFISGALPSEFNIIGFARRPLGIDGFRALTKDAITGSKAKNNKTYEEKHLVDFLNHVTYTTGDLENLEDFKILGKLMEGNDATLGFCSNKLFYLAVPPTLYEIIFKNISSAGLTVPCAPGVSAKEEENSWTRVLVEKPFGKDLEQAERLDTLLGELFDETQIFRIDHYLAKENVQNILKFRFQNSVLETDWDNVHVEKVRIVFHEANTLVNRGGFYDGVGALRDVGQNHMLVMLALVAMENPGEMSTQNIHHAREAVLSKTVLLKDQPIVRGQYNGYTDETNVAKDSKTETFFRVMLGVENDRWRGVPFELESGKALVKADVSIEVYFKGKSECVTFSISSNVGVTYDAYEKVFRDCLLGDQTLFTTTGEVIAEWKLITHIINTWQDVPLIFYEKGTEGNQIK